MIDEAVLEAIHNRFSAMDEDGSGALTADDLVVEPLGIAPTADAKAVYRGQERVKKWLDEVPERVAKKAMVLSRARSVVLAAVEGLSFDAKSFDAKSFDAKSFDAKSSSLSRPKDDANNKKLSSKRPKISFAPDVTGSEGTPGDPPRARLQRTNTPKSPPPPSVGTSNSFVDSLEAEASSLRNQVHDLRVQVKKEELKIEIDLLRVSEKELEMQLYGARSQTRMSRGLQKTPPTLEHQPAPIYSIVLDADEPEEARVLGNTGRPLAPGRGSTPDSRDSRVAGSTPDSRDRGAAGSHNPLNSRDRTSQSEPRRHSSASSRHAAEHPVRVDDIGSPAGHHRKVAVVRSRLAAQKASFVRYPHVHSKQRDPSRFSPEHQRGSLSSRNATPSPQPQQRKAPPVILKPRARALTPPPLD